MLAAKQEMVFLTPSAGDATHTVFQLNTIAYHNGQPVMAKPTPFQVPGRGFPTAPLVVSVRSGAAECGRRARRLEPGGRGRL